MSKNSTRRRVGLRVPSLAALSDFDPNGEYGENTVDPFDAYWKQQSDQWVSEQADSLLDDLHNGGTIWGDEPDLRPLQPLELKQSRFNWRNFAFYALAFTGLVLSQVLIAMAVEAAR